MFVFDRGDGRDMIVDWQDDVDRIRIESGASGFADLVIRQQADDDAVIRFAEVAIEMKGALAAVFGADDVAFG